MSGPIWDDRPSSAPRLPIVVVNPPRKGSLILRLLGGWVGVLLHWRETRPRYPKGRSLPCLGDDCPIDHRVDVPFWYGYAPALLYRVVFTEQECRQTHLWEPAIAPITDEIALTVLNGKQPRGLVIRLSRGDKGSLLTAEVLEKVTVDPLPPPFDVKPILLRMWGIREKPAEAVAARSIVEQLAGQAEAKNGAAGDRRKGGAA